MFFNIPSLSGVPSRASVVLDMTADPAPLLSGMLIVFGLSLVGLVLAVRRHNTWQEQPPARMTREEGIVLPDAA